MSLTSFQSCLFLSLCFIEQGYHFAKWRNELPTRNKIVRVDVAPPHPLVSIHGCCVVYFGVMRCGVMRCGVMWCGVWHGVLYIDLAG